MNYYRQVVDPPSLLTEQTLPIAAEIIVGTVVVPDYLSTCGTNYSLTSQLGAILGKRTPDVIAFTAESALPMAHVVQGVCDAAGLNPPTMISIGINRSATYNPVELSQEVTRLEPKISGADVVIVDQFSQRRRHGVLRTSEEVARQAGARTTSTIAGLWYRDALKVDPECPDIPAVVLHSDPRALGQGTPLRQRLYELGKICYERYSQISDKRYTQ